MAKKKAKMSCDPKCHKIMVGVCTVLAIISIVAICFAVFENDSCDAENVMVDEEGNVLILEEGTDNLAGEAYFGFQGRFLTKGANCCTGCDPPLQNAGCCGDTCHQYCSNC